jgi:tetratricopeptide (TPR) repeat protein
MASSARIDELRKKFDENPRRYFAPLANEYRKIGDLDQAIFICQEYLPQQPGHMSGHIVYGQALFETGRLDEARTVFETALTLDPENLIALRHLGDIANGSGDLAAARAWYQRVLEADPRNEEIATLLNALLSQPEAAAETASHVPADPPPAPASASRHTPAFSWGDAPRAEDRPPEVPEVREVPEAPSESPDWQANLVIERASEAATPVVPIPAQAEHELFDISDLNVGDETFSSVRRPSREIDLGPVPDIEIVDPIPAEPAALFEADHLAITGVQGDTAVAPPAHVIEDPPLAGRSDEWTLDALDVPSTPPPAEEAAVPGGSDMPFVTETMAELYLQQGHRREAIDIYRQLVGQRPDDVTLRGRLAELEPSGAPAQPAAEVARRELAHAGPSIRTFLRGILWPPAAPGPSPEVPLRHGDGGVGSSDALFPNGSGNPLDDTMATLLSEGYRVDEPAEGPLRGVPAHRATGELSLEQVFGGQSGSDLRTPRDGLAQGGHGFIDQFFAGSSSAEEKGTGTPESDVQPSAGKDIEQFNSWLHGLKNT